MEPNNDDIGRLGLTSHWVSMNGNSLMKLTLEVGAEITFAQKVVKNRTIPT